MKVTFFPGCTLRTKAKDLEKYTYSSAEALGIKLCELENWQCCGGVFSTANDEIASKLPSIRALASSAKENQPLVTVCSACHNVIKQTNHAMQTDADFAFKANNYLSQDKDFTSPYNGDAKVVHFLELLRNHIGFDNIKSKVKNPLTGKKIAAYYGCLLLRPSSVMKMDDPENPQIMEDLIRAMGASPVIYPKRNECCGGYVVLEDPLSAGKKSKEVYENAVNHGADMIITACPLCKYNLVKNGCRIPVVYFTEILADALGVKEDNNE